MGHLLVTCGEFERDRWVLMDEVSRIAGIGGVCKEGEMALLFGRSVEGISDSNGGWWVNVYRI